MRWADDDHDTGAHIDTLELLLHESGYASSGSQAAVGLFWWIDRSPRLINDITVPSW